VPAAGHRSAHRRRIFEIHPIVYLDDTSEFPRWLLYAPPPLPRTIKFVLGVLLNVMVQGVSKMNNDTRLLSGRQPTAIFSGK